MWTPTIDVTDIIAEHDGDDVHDEEEKGNKEKSENYGDIWSMFHTKVFHKLFRYIILLN